MIYSPLLLTLFSEKIREDITLDEKRLINLYYLTLMILLVSSGERVPSYLLDKIGGEREGGL